MLRILLLATLMLVGPLAMAQEPSGILAQGNNPLSIPAITLTTDAEGQQEYSVSLQILLIMTALSIIVFSILRQALGLQQTPSNQILIGLTLFLTLFIMAPVFDRINQDALQPYLSEQIPAQEAIARAEVPLKNFMLAQTRESDLELFVRLSQRTDIASPEAAPMTILVPAFVTSELKTAFQIIDMVVASVLMAMGMMMLSPLIISLPFKIMLFVLVDGWGLIIGTLAGSFGTL
jgi:flagellar biosynthesis protein FliP